MPNCGYDWTITRLEYAVITRHTTDSQKYILNVANDEYDYKNSDSPNE